MSQKDYYSILNISPNATKQDIKRAYRTLAKKFHPDSSNTSEETEELFKEINEAYKILSNPEKKKEYDASIIGLVMDETGSPKTADKRLENAGKLLAKAMEYDISPDRLFLDPIVMPLKFMQDQCKEILSAANQFQLFSDPPPHIVCGLSNVANGTKYKKLINRTFCTMLIANGLDAVILDLTDDDLVDAILTAELVMNKQIYADGYVEAFRK